MLQKTIVLLACVLFIIIHTNGQDYYYGNYANNFNDGFTTSIADWYNPRGQTTDYGNGKVTVQVYYEVHCPACKHFVTGVFKETVLELGPYLDVKLYPYGNAKTINSGYGYEFTSQHGPAETYGNKLHACAVDLLQNMTTAVLFNSCMMDSSQAGKGSDDAAADVCVRSMGVNSEAIKQSAKSYRGTQLLKYCGDESMKVGFKTVPTILVNRMKVESENFKEKVYDALRNPPRLY